MLHTSQHSPSLALVALACIDRSLRSCVCIMCEDRHKDNECQDGPPVGAIMPCDKRVRCKLPQLCCHLDDKIVVLMER